MTECQRFYVRTEVGVEGRFRPNRRVDGASKKSGDSCSVQIPVP
jgi:hypothetical protein